MGVEDFFHFVRYACRGAIVPRIDEAGGLSTDYSPVRESLQRLDAVVIEAMHCLHAAAYNLQVGSSPQLFFQRLMDNMVGEACSSQRVTTIVLLFDSGSHAMKGQEHAKRSGAGKHDELPKTFEEKWLKDRKMRGVLLDELRSYLEENLSIRDGLNVVVHGLWPEPRVFWREGDMRHVSTPVERALAPADIKWPTTCYEADDLVMLWVKLLLYPCDGGPAYNVMVVATDADILLDMLVHMSLLCALPEAKQPRPRDDADTGVVCLFRGECVAGSVPSSPRDKPVKAPEYIDVIAAADTLSNTFTPAMLPWAPGPAAGGKINTTLVAIAAMWLCHRHDYHPSTWVHFCAEVHVWFPLVVHALCNGDVGSTLQMRYSGEPGAWTPVEVRINPTGLRDTFAAAETHFRKWKHARDTEGKVKKMSEEIKVLRGAGVLKSVDNAKQRLEAVQNQPPPPNKPRPDAHYHAQAARLALWMAKRLNNHLPGWRGLPSELERDGELSRWGYAEQSVQNEAALSVGFPPHPSVCVPTEDVAQRAVYFVPNSA